MVACHSRQLNVLVEHSKLPQGYPKVANEVVNDPNVGGGTFPVLGVQSARQVSADRKWEPSN